MTSLGNTQQKIPNELTTGGNNDVFFGPVIDNNEPSLTYIVNSIIDVIVFVPKTMFFLQMMSLDRI